MNPASLFCTMQCSLCPCMPLSQIALPEVTAAGAATARQPALTAWRACTQPAAMLAAADLRRANKLDMCRLSLSECRSQHVSCTPQVLQAAAGGSFSPHAAGAATALARQQAQAGTRTSLRPGV